MNVLVLAHALPTRISPHIASPIVTFLSYMSNSTSGVLTTSVLEYAVLILVVGVKTGRSRVGGPELCV